MWYVSALKDGVVIKQSRFFYITDTIFEAFIMDRVNLGVLRAPFIFILADVSSGYSVLPFDVLWGIAEETVIGGFCGGFSVYCKEMKIKHKILT